MNKEIIRVWFEDMWGYEQYLFNINDNYFTNMLSLKYDVVLDENAPDLLIYSCFSKNHLRYNGRCKKLFYCGENISPSDPTRKLDADLSECDMFLGKFPTDDVHYYHPLWVMFVDWFKQNQPRPLPSNPTYHVNLSGLTARTNVIGEKKFCCFINNNPIKNRMELFSGLSRHKKVDSYGSLLNNVGYDLRGSEEDKIKVLQNYKFSIAYENSHFPGYITEKIIHPYSVGSIAIYSGGFDREVFNNRSMVLREDYSTLQDMIDRVIDIDENDDLYQEYLSQPLFVGDRIGDQFYPDRVLRWIEDRL